MSSILIRFLQAFKSLSPFEKVMTSQMSKSKILGLRVNLAAHTQN
jgi:hypothetical protein